MRIQLLSSGSCENVNNFYSPPLSVEIIESESDPEYKYEIFVSGFEDEKTFGSNLEECINNLHSIYLCPFVHELDADLEKVQPLYDHVKKHINHLKFTPPKGYISLDGSEFIMVKD